MNFKPQLHFPIVIFNCALLQSATCLDANRDICHLKSCHNNDGLYVSHHMGQFCSSHGYTQDGRCCIDAFQNGTGHGQVTGVDLTECNVTSLEFLQHPQAGKYTYNKTLVQLLMLNDNPFSNCSAEDFADYINLELLTLPSDCDCPGGAEAWQRVTYTHNYTGCDGEIDVCSQYNVSCLQHSSCGMHAPGQTWCRCSSGYHGYKCLRQGSFPEVAYTLGLTAVTVLLAVALHITNACSK